MNCAATANRILLVDDDQELTALLREYLEGQGLEVTVRNDGEAGLTVDESSYDLMVLDIMMPGKSGMDVLREVRARGHKPVLMLTARGDEIDRIVGLEVGADDYLAKPCNPRELLARVHAVLRRAGGAGEPGASLINGDLTMRPSGRSVRVNETDPELTSTEYSILELLMRNVGQVVSKESICEAVLGRPLGRFDRNVDMHISNVRRKLVDVGLRASFIETIRGTGYMVTEP